MLPDAKKVAGDILAKMKVPEPKADAGPEAADLPEPPDEGLQAAADDLMVAVKGGDAAGVAAALRNAFEQMGGE